MSLKNIQKAFVDFIYHNKELGAVGEDIESSSLQDSMMVYRRHVWFTLINTLKIHYESVLNLLGHELFLKLSQEYVSKYPSQTPDLELYGFEFPQFLKDNESVPKYASDLANIDISYVKASIAENFKINTIKEFQNIRQDDYERIVFSVNPTNIICKLEYNVINYFEYIKSNKKEKAIPNIGKKDNIIIVSRNSHNNIHHKTISSLELEFLKECKKGEKFINIFEKLYKMDKEFDLQKILINMIENQFIIRFTIN